VSSFAWLLIDWLAVSTPSFLPRAFNCPIIDIIAINRDVAIGRLFAVVRHVQAERCTRMAAHHVARWAAPWVAALHRAVLRGNVLLRV
jgi:hypothetical protein